MGTILNYSASGATAGKLTSVFCDLNTCNYTFNAKELDEESGMYYYGARYYAPPTFVSRDPAFQEYPATSPYAYCLNNPVRHIDPDGKRVFAHDARTKRYMKRYFKEHFGSSRMFKFDNYTNELKIREKSFRKAEAGANEHQAKLLSGMKDAIGHNNKALVRIEKNTKGVMEFDVGAAHPTSSLPVNQHGGGAAGESQNYGGILVGVSHNEAQNNSLSAPSQFMNINIGKDDCIGVEERKQTTGNSASSVFFHEVLDEFLNFFSTGKVNERSPNMDQREYQNAALRNIGKLESDESH